MEIFRWDVSLFLSINLLGFILIFCYRDVLVSLGVKYFFKEYILVFV